VTVDARARLARRLGIAPVWRDMEGREHRPGPETHTALLRAMGIDADTDAAAEAALAELEAEDARGGAVHEVVARAGDSVMLRVHGD
jgi:4-alpha-glucanotransferase